MTPNEHASRKGEPLAGGGPLHPLVSKVVAELCSRNHPLPSEARDAIADFLLRAVTAQGPFDEVAVSDELRRHCVSSDSLIDIYIPLIATMLGDMWKQSELSFADVTVGVLRLQTVLSNAEAEFEKLQFDFHKRPAALVVVPEGEQHFLGALTAAAQLRKLGCEAAISLSESRRQIVARVAAEHPDMVLLSCARTEALESVLELAKSVRKIASPDLIVAVGGAFDQDRMLYNGGSDVDLVTRSATDVFNLHKRRCEKLDQE